MLMLGSACHVLEAPCPSVADFWSQGFPGLGFCTPVSGAQGEGRQGRGACVVVLVHTARNPRSSVHVVAVDINQH